jgi:hypothetical protein
LVISAQPTVDGEFGSKSPPQSRTASDVLSTLASPRRTTFDSTDIALSNGKFLVFGIGIRKRKQIQNSTPSLGNLGNMNTLLPLIKALSDMTF